MFGGSQVARQDIYRQDRHGRSMDWSAPPSAVQRRGHVGGGCGPLVCCAGLTLSAPHRSWIQRRRKRLPYWSERHRLDRWVRQN